MSVAVVEGEVEWELEWNVELICSRSHKRGFALVSRNRRCRAMR